MEGGGSFSLSIHTHFARRVVHICEARNGRETAKYRSNDIQTIIQTLEDTIECNTEKRKIPIDSLT